MSLWLWIIRPKPSPRPPDPAPPGDWPGQLLYLHNAARGVNPLVLDPKLTQAAQEHADDMSRRDRLDHANFAQRAARWGFLAENAAWGYASAAECWQGWYGSAGHRANATHPGYRQCGFGRAGLYWCAVYA